MFLRLASVLNMLLALLHIAIIFAGPAAFRFFRAPESFAVGAAAGDPSPALITFAIAGVFAIWSLYAASAAGLLRALPRAKVVVGLIAAIFLLRGLLVIPQSLKAAHFINAIEKIEPRDIVFSICALAIGAVHIAGLMQLVRKERHVLGK
nr:hypothetical protein [uncultured Cohaesibacter sp.]